MTGDTALSLSDDVVHIFTSHFLLSQLLFYLFCL